MKHIYIFLPRETRPPLLVLCDPLDQTPTPDDRDLHLKRTISKSDKAHVAKRVIDLRNPRVLNIHVILFPVDKFFYFNIICNIPLSLKYLFTNFIIIACDNKNTTALRHDGLSSHIAFWITAHQTLMTSMGSLSYLVIIHAT